MRRDLAASPVVLALAAALPRDANRTPVLCQRPEGGTAPPIWPFACAPR